MQSVRTALWVVIAVIITIFAAMNSEDVEVHVTPGLSGYVIEPPLGLLIIVVYLLGFLPPYMINLINRWRLNRKIRQQDQTIALLRPTPAPVSTEIAPVTPTPLSSTETTA